MHLLRGPVRAVTISAYEQRPLRFFPDARAASVNHGPSIYPLTVLTDFALSAWQEEQLQRLSLHSTIRIGVTERNNKDEPGPFGAQRAINKLQLR
jgi:hypothetical protein